MLENNYWYKKLGLFDGLRKEKSKSFLQEMLWIYYINIINRCFTEYKRVIQIFIYNIVELNLIIFIIMPICNFHI